MKKIISFIISLSLIISAVSICRADYDYVNFTDVGSLPDIVAEALEFCAGNGYISGYEDNTFRPNNNITRAEFAAIMCRFMGYEPSAASSFSDTREHWARGYIEACADHGIINGIGDGLFAPDESVTYEQAERVVMLAMDFTTDENISYMGGYPFGYLKFAYTIGLTADFVGMTDWEMWRVPDIPATRVNIANMLYNTLYAEQLADEKGMALNEIYAAYLFLVTPENADVSEMRVYDDYGTWSDNLLEEPISADDYGYVSYVTNNPDITSVEMKIGGTYYKWNSDESAVDLLYNNTLVVFPNENGIGYGLYSENSN